MLEPVSCIENKTRNGGHGRRVDKDQRPRRILVPAAGYAEQKLSDYDKENIIEVSI